MTEYKSDFLQTMARRGYLHQCTDGEALDPLAIMRLRRLQQAGHKPIVRMGGGTTKVGDPSGKDEQRKLLTEADIAANMASIKTVFNRFVKFGDGPTDAIMVNNADWLDKLQYIEFLRDYGRHFSVNRMLSFDSVKLRLDREQPL